MARNTTSDTAPIYVEIPTALAAELRALAGRNGRSLTDEARHAFRRHLDTPPTMSVAPLPPADAAEVQPRKRGRPPKSKP